MSTITGNTSIALNGTTSFKVGTDSYSWSKSKFILGIDIWSETSPSPTATVTLSSFGWSVGTLRFVGTTKAVLKDSSTGEGGYINHLRLGSTAGATVTLDKTEVGAIDGSSAVEKVTLGSGYIDTISLRDGNDVVTTGSGDVGAIHVGHGNNTVNIGNGSVESVIAFDDNDTFTTSDDSDVDSVNLGGGNNTITLGGGEVGTIVTYDGKDTVIAGSSRIDVVSLGGGDDTFTGGSGKIDMLNLGDGTNTAKTGARRVDAIIAYGGDDTVIVGSGGAGSIDLSGGADNLTTGSGRVQSIVTSAGNDVVKIGAGGAGTVVLGSDDDFLSLSQLANVTDLLVAGGSSGIDTVSFAAFTSAVSIKLSSSEVINTGKGYFALFGFESVTGGKGADTLSGSEAVNIIQGGAGADTLTGLGGADDLYGGAGGDNFVYTDIVHSGSTVAAADTIFDFSGTGGDRIDLSAIDASTKSSGNQAFSFIGTTAFSNKAGELRYVKQASDTYIYADVNGDGKTDMAIHLDDAVTMDKGYFIL